MGSLGFKDRNFTRLYVLQYPDLCCSLILERIPCLVSPKCQPTQISTYKKERTLKPMFPTRKLIRLCVDSQLTWTKCFQ